MKLQIKTTNNHLKTEMLSIFQQITFNNDNIWESNKIMVADNFIDDIEIHSSYITINFDARKYIYGGIRSYGINRSMIDSFEVIS